MYSSGTMSGQVTQRNLQKRMMAPKDSDLWWYGEPSQLLTSLAELIQICSDNAAILLNCNARVAYLPHFVWLESTERKRRYLASHGNTLLGFLPARIRA